MYRLAVIAALLLAVPALAGKTSRDEKADRVLQMDRLLTVRIHMTPQQWRMMQPERASRLATALAVVQHPTTQQAIDIAQGAKSQNAQHVQPADGQRRPPGLTGNEYAYVDATVQIDGQTYNHVGVEYR